MSEEGGRGGKGKGGGGGTGRRSLLLCTNLIASNIRGPKNIKKDKKDKGYYDD